MFQFVRIIKNINILKIPIAILIMVLTLSGNQLSINSSCSSPNVVDNSIFTVCNSDKNNTLGVVIFNIDSNLNIIAKYPIKILKNHNVLHVFPVSKREILIISVIQKNELSSLMLVKYDTKSKRIIWKKEHQENGKINFKLSLSDQAFLYDDGNFVFPMLIEKKGEKYYKLIKAGNNKIFWEYNLTKVANKKNYNLIKIDKLINNQEELIIFLRSNDNNHCKIIKLNKNGQVIWEKKFGDKTAKESTLLIHSFDIMKNSIVLYGNIFSYKSVKDIFFKLNYSGEVDTFQIIEHKKDYIFRPISIIDKNENENKYTFLGIKTNQSHEIIGLMAIEYHQKSKTYNELSILNTNLIPTLLSKNEKYINIGLINKKSKLLQFIQVDKKTYNVKNHIKYDDLQIYPTAFLIRFLKIKNQEFLSFLYIKKNNVFTFFSKIVNPDKKENSIIKSKNRKEFSEPTGLNINDF